MTIKQLWKIFFKTGFIQIGLVFLFYLVLFWSKKSSIESSQAVTVMALFSFIISTVLNIVGMLVGSSFVGLINKNLSFYVIIIVSPLFIIGSILFFMNKLESQFLIFLVPAFSAFIISHLISFFSIMKTNK
jgi:hypothetical protein